MGDQNISLYKGEKQDLNIVVEDDDNNPIDLTVSDVEDVFMVVSTGLARYGEQKFELTGKNLTQNGDVEFTVEKSDTNSLKPSNYLYEIYVKYNSSSNYTAEVGRFFVKPAVRNN